MSKGVRHEHGVDITHRLTDNIVNDLRLLRDVSSMTQEEFKELSEVLKNIELRSVSFNSLINL